MMYNSRVDRLTTDWSPTPKALNAAKIIRLNLVQFVLGRFYQNVGEIVHERYQAGRNFHIAFFVQPFAQLEQFIVDA
jgi:hypothetical protein